MEASRSEWENHLDHDQKTGSKYSLFVLTLEMQRLPAYILWFIITPLFLIVLLSTSMFWVGRQSLDMRVDISFIGLLTIVAYQSIVVSQMPQIAYFTLLDGFIYTAYFTMTACIIANIWVGRLDRRGETQVADRFDRFGRWFFPSRFFVLNILSALYFYYL